MVRANNRKFSGRKRVGMSGPTNKPFAISKELVMEAYGRVKANQGAAGVDGVSLKEFEKDLRNNLYKIWTNVLWHVFPSSGQGG